MDLGYKFVYYLHLVKLAFFGRKNEKGIVLEKELKRAEIMLGSTPNLWFCHLGDKQLITKGVELLHQKRSWHRRNKHKTEGNDVSRFLS